MARRHKVATVWSEQRERPVWAKKAKTRSTKPVGIAQKKQTEPHRMVGWHNAVATRLGEALAETEKRCNTLIHSFLSPRFTGLKNMFIPQQGRPASASLRRDGALALFACPCLSSFAPRGGSPIRLATQA